MRNLTATAWLATRGGMYIYIRVDDVDVEYDRQIGLGLQPHTQPRDWDWGNREFITKDPDGYKLCFGSH